MKSVQCALGSGGLASSAHHSVVREVLPGEESPLPPGGHSPTTIPLTIPLTMPYLIVRESYLDCSCLVDGLPLNEVRTVTEKSSCPSDLRDEKNRRVEFSTPAYNLLNALEKIGYRVVTSSSFVTGHKKFDTKDFVWTLYKNCYDKDFG